MPSIETSVALEVCQLNVADCPFCTVSGLTEIDAVGEGGGGGGGGGGGAAFFLQAASIRTANNAIMVASVLTVCCVTFFFKLILFTFDSSCEPESFSSSDEVFYSKIIYFQLQLGCELRPVKVS
jgi:hypothetical protein